MTRRLRVLLVANNPCVASAVAFSLRHDGFEVAIVTTCRAAKERLERRPDLVIAEVKLGSDNGLQVALRAHGAGIPSIVLGPQDVVLERDAGDLGATYLTTLPGPSRLVELARRLVGREGAAPGGDHAESPASPAARHGVSMLLH